MTGRARNVGWLLLAAAVGWQALRGSGEALHTAWQGREAGWHARWLADTESRVRRSLGADAEVTRVLAAAARHGEPAWVRIDVVPESFAGEQSLVARLTRMRHVLFPQPVLAYGGDDPVATAEALTPHGASGLVLVRVRAGEAAPRDRAGWSCVHRDDDFEAWRLQR